MRPDGAHGGQSPAGSRRAAPGRVLVVGDVVTDVLGVLDTPLAGGAGLALGSDTPASITVTAGGSAANTASWLAAAGVPVTLIGAVGDDTAGRARVEELTTDGVRCLVDRRPDARTGTVVVLSDGAERTMLCDRGANRLLTPQHVAAAMADSPGAAHLHLSAYPLFDPRSRPGALLALRHARAAGLTTSVDAASAAPLRRWGPASFRARVGSVDLLLANLDEAKTLVADPHTDPVGAAHRLLDLARVVVVKAGRDGAVRVDGQEVHVLAAVPTHAVDPTGAGDAFAAGMLAAQRYGASAGETLQAAVTLGAYAVRRHGARPSGPVQPLGPDAQTS